MHNPMRQSTPLLIRSQAAHGPIGSEQTKNLCLHIFPNGPRDRGGITIVIAIIGAGFDDTTTSVVKSPLRVVPSPFVSEDLQPPPRPPIQFGFVNQPLLNTVTRPPRNPS